jgi:hypothetical protein
MLAFLLNPIKMINSFFDKLQRQEELLNQMDGDHFRPMKYVFVDHKAYKDIFTK